MESERGVQGEKKEVLVLGYRQTSFAQASHKAGQAFPPNITLGKVPLVRLVWLPTCTW